MKKIITIALIAVLCLSLAACGVDTQPATDALNEVANTFNSVATVMNESKDDYPEEAFTFMTELSEKITEHQATLTAEDVTEEELNAIIEWCGPIMERLNEIKTTYGIE